MDEEKERNVPIEGKVGRRERESDEKRNGMGGYWIGKG